MKNRISDEEGLEQMATVCSTLASANILLLATVALLYQVKY